MADTAISQAAPAAPAADSSAQQTSENSNTNGQQANNQQQADAAQATINNPNASPAQKVQAAKKLRSLKIKIDGQEFDEQLPFEIEDTPANREYMAKQLQYSKVAQKRMGETALLQKEVKAFLENLQKNPRKALSDPRLGVDVKKLAADVIQQEIENAQKSPDQLEREKLAQELQELKEQREAEKKDYEQKEFERLQAAEYERYDTMISDAVEKSDLPKSPYVVKKMADYMLLGLQNNIDLSPAEILPLVREEIMSDVRQMFGAAPEDVIESLIGKDVLSRLRKKNIAKAKAQPATQAKGGIKDVGTKTAEKPKEEVKKLSYKQFFGV